MSWRDLWILDPSGDLIAAYHSPDPDLVERLRSDARAVFDDGTARQVDESGVRIQLVPIQSENFSGTAMVLLDPPPETLEVVGLAHDINNLLAVAQGHIELARRPDNADLSLSEALWILKRAGVLVRRMAGFSMADGEDWSVPVKDTLQHLTRHLDGSRHPVRWAIAENLPLAAVDLATFVEIFHNLLENAVEAMPNGGPVHIAASAQKDRITVSIADFGPGMTSDEAARAFDAYVTHKAGGHGLGLYRTRQLVEQYHGEIAIKSGPEIGTTVTVVLPAALAEYERLR